VRREISRRADSAKWKAENCNVRSKNARAELPAHPSYESTSTPKREAIFESSISSLTPS